jgi:SAM-dependent methyltransferase
MAAYNAAMPALSHQPPSAAVMQWFLQPAGLAVLDSEQTVVADALAAHPVVGLPWLWCAPALSEQMPEGRGLRLSPRNDGWQGAVRCRLPLPMASESLGAVVLQHVLGVDGADPVALIDECARVLVPGGRLALLALNPLSPYRFRWRRQGLSAHDPGHWRRLLSDAGLTPEPAARGVGPQWTPTASPSVQSGPGLRAAYLQRAEKRALPITPIRQRPPLAIADGVPAV